VADSNQTCYAIDMENPVPAVDGDMAAVTCTSIPTANAYDRPGDRMRCRDRDAKPRRTEECQSAAGLGAKALHRIEAGNLRAHGVNDAPPAK
jgi:hypothetical protein